MQDDKTPHYSLPLPHADNFLEDDVDRLRSALIELDTQLDAARLARSTLAESLTTLTGAQSGLGGDLSALLNSLNSHKAAPASASSPGHAKPGVGLSADAAGTLSVAYGTNPGTACQGNDPRLSADRAPIAHATSHKTGGADVITPASIGALDAAHANQTASTEVVGHTRLNNTVTSTSTTEAGTANAVKTAYDKAVSAASAASSAQTVAYSRAPVPQQYSGVGQWVGGGKFSTGSQGVTVLPSGGAWLLLLTSINSSGGTYGLWYAGIVSGGTSASAYINSGTPYGMWWAWRIA